MKSGNLTRSSGFVVAADEGQPFWFLNTLTITKVGSDQCGGQLGIVDHRMPPGFAPPPHIHHQSDEALLVLDGQLKGICGHHPWQAGPGSLAFMPRAIPHGFTISDAGPGRIIIVATPGGFDQVRRGRRRASPGPAPARTRPSRPRPPHPARGRSRHPDPAPARTLTTPSQASARLPAGQTATRSPTRSTRPRHRQRQLHRPGLPRGLRRRPGTRTAITRAGRQPRGHRQHGNGPNPLIRRCPHP